jgi:hypothetical protein
MLCTATASAKRWHFLAHALAKASDLLMCTQSKSEGLGSQENKGCGMLWR